MGNSDNDGDKLPSTQARQRSKNGGKKEDKDESCMPDLPPHLKKASGVASTTAHDSDEASKSESEDESEEYCPALPPHMLQGGNRRPVSLPPQRRSLVGPMLPKGFAPPTEDPAVKGDIEEGEEKEDEEEGEEKEDEEEEEEEEGDSAIGPLPPVHKVDTKEYRAWELEERARKMRDKLEGRDVDTNKPIVRESWMTELPEDKPNFCGLGARQFLRKTPKEKGDRSCWTDTPTDKARKEQEEEQQQKEESTPEDDATKQRDKQLTEKVDEYNKAKRAKPLVELHRKELKRKQSDEGPKERRPFSREEDLNVNKFDDAQREKILKKAQKLNDRFSAGKAKFL